MLVLFEHRYYACMRTCEIAACDRPHKAKGLCALHYGRNRRLGDPKAHLDLYEKDRPKTCSVIGCEAMTHTGAMCSSHYQRWRRHGDPLGGGRQRRKRGTPPPPCSIEGCDSPSLSRGWCSQHYVRWAKYGDPLEPDHSIRRQVCTVDGCDELWAARGYCRKHYRRWEVHGDPTMVITPKRSEAWKRDANGYVSRYWPEHPNANGSKRVTQHVAVMAEHLGRPIRKGETVHHKNGVRYDNRIENLELWSRSHTPGQRVADLIVWARELLAEYEAEAELIGA